MQVNPDFIIIKKRIRKDPGSLEALVESLKKYGQLNPIIINRQFELIAGHRRLEAAKLLGWHSINAIILDRHTEREKLEIELEENIQRSKLTVEEISDGFSRLEKLRRKGLLRRILDFILKLFNTIFTRRKL